MARVEDAIASVVRILNQLGLPYMVIGGLANLVWGEARTTEDIDVTIQVDSHKTAETVATLGQVFQALPQNALAFVRQTRVLPVVTPEGTRLDLIFAQLPYQEDAIRRARTVTIGNAEVRVCTPEDLIVHKIISDRARDLDDVKGVVRVQGSRLDRAYLDPLVLGLSIDLERPEIQEFYLSLWCKPKRRG